MNVLCNIETILIILMCYLIKFKNNYLSSCLKTHFHSNYYHKSLSFLQIYYELMQIKKTT